MRDVVFDPFPGSLHEPINGREMSPAEIFRRVTLRRNFFQSRGMAHGDRVFIGYGNCIEFFVDLLSIWSLGGTVVPLDTALTAFEIENQIRAVQPAFFLHMDPTPSNVTTSLEATGITAIEAREGENARSQSDAPTDLLPHTGEALILFTSGSTSQPKGVVHTHQSLRAKWSALKATLGVEIFRRSLCMLPTHFGHGLICNCLYPWLAGQDLYLLPSFSPAVSLTLGQILAERQITFMSSVPAMWQLTLRSRRPVTTKLEEVFCGSAPLSSYLWEQIREWCVGATVRNVYGITEVGSWIAGTAPGDLPRDNLIGKPWGTEIKIAKCSDPENVSSADQACPIGTEGAIWVKTRALMQGYLDREDLTKRAVAKGWFSTGDIGVIDNSGQLILCGRIRDEINRGGIKIYPADIEALIERHPKVKDACAFGYDDRLLWSSGGFGFSCAKSQ